VLGVRKTVTGLVYSERDVVLADEGDLLVGFDYAGLDARVVAGLSGDPAYAELVLSGDIHAEVAEIFFGDRARRDDAKRITHGLNYGAGPAAVAKIIGCDVDTAEHRMGGFLRRFPQLARWQAELRAAGERGLPLNTGTGRTVHAHAGREHTTAAARVAQGAATDLVTTGLLTLEDAGLLDRVRLCVHDELILSWPAAAAEAAGTELASHVSFDWASPSRLTIPIVAVAHGHTGLRWSDLYRQQRWGAWRTEG